jgi:hypothetical protein
MMHFFFFFFFMEIYYLTSTCLEIIALIKKTDSIFNINLLFNLLKKIRCRILYLNLTQILRI